MQPNDVTFETTRPLDDETRGISTSWHKRNNDQAKARQRREKK